MPLSDDLKEQIHDLCHYHPPDAERAKKHEAINAACEAFIQVIVENCPSSPDASAAVRLARQARMEANSALATKSGGLIRW